MQLITSHDKKDYDGKTNAQVYAINDVAASLLIQLAVVLSSPLLFLLSNTGAVIGSLLLSPSQRLTAGRLFPCIRSGQ